MKDIESRANPLFRQWLKQVANAGRAGHPVWLEGPHLCQSWLQNNRPVSWLLMDRTCFEDPEILSIRDQVRSDKWVLLAPDLFKALSDVPSNQGVMVVGDPPVQSELAEIGMDGGSVVILDGIQDPGNVGSILRTCAAIGVKTVLASAGTAACWSPKVLRSAQGAHAGLNIFDRFDVMTWLKSYRQRSDRLIVIATTLEQSNHLYTTHLPECAIWMFGSEGQGLDPRLLAMADLRIRIDHDQQFVESLNVATATALCLFEQARQTDIRQPNVFAQ